MFRRLFVYGKISVDIINISSRAMMGEFIIYYRGKAFGGIYDDRLLVKSVPVAVKMMPDAENGLLHASGFGRHGQYP